MIMRHPVQSAAILLAVLCGADAGAAQTPIDRTVATPATGTVEVFNISGEIRVVGWDRSEVRVTGTLGEGTERLDVATSGDRVRIEVVIPRGAREVEESTLEVRVPSRKNVTARGVSAEVAVSGVTGNVDAQSTSGSVEVTGSPATLRAASTSGDIEVEVTTARLEANSTSGSVRVGGTVRESLTAESVSGDVEVTAPAPEILAKSVSGNVTLSGASRRLSVSTVSGDMEVRNARLQYGSFESVSGGLQLAGQLEPDAAVNAQSHSGDIVLALPASISARFEVSTFSGDIRNSFGARSERRNEHGPGEDLRFTTGNGGALITVKTFSGDVELERR
jgi:DUF4097 and DUF4098 domain-containing protein YvlB